MPGHRDCVHCIATRTAWRDSCAERRSGPRTQPVGERSAIRLDRGHKTNKGKENAEHLDTFWGIKTPNPLPAPGAKVTVTGTYSTTFMQASAGAEADPYQGIMSYQEMTVLEPAAELATLPGRQT